MNKLNNVEAEYLRLISPHLKEGTDKQTIINILRVSTAAAAAVGKQQGRHGYQGDVTWSDDQLK